MHKMSLFALTTGVVAALTAGYGFAYWRWRSKRLLDLWEIPVFLWICIGVIWVWRWWGKEGVARVVARWIAPDAQPEAAATGAAMLASAGQAGDLYGGFNSLFAALAFVGGAAALFFQARAMHAAREQLRLQQEQIKLQTFEPMFVKLVDIHQHITESIDLSHDPALSGIRDGSAPIRLDAAIDRWLELARKQLFERFKRGDYWAKGMPDTAALLADAKAFYAREVWSGNEHAIGRYFRSMYYLFKFIKMSSLDDQQKVRYANIARSSLGSNHLALLVMNCLSPQGAGFKPLVEEYGLLKHLVRGDEFANAGSAAELIACLAFSPAAWMTANKRQALWISDPDVRPQDLTED